MIRFNNFSKLLIGVLLLINTSVFSQELGKEENGKASYYAHIFNGRPTSSGERLNQKEFTAAHRTLPFNTMVEITNLLNNKSVIVRINDRGPFHKTRLIDVSHAAAQYIGLVRAGVANVKIKVIGCDGKVVSTPNQNFLKEVTKWLIHLNPLQSPTFK